MPIVPIDFNPVLVIYVAIIIIVVVVYDKIRVTLSRETTASGAQSFKKDKTTNRLHVHWM